MAATFAEYLDGLEDEALASLLARRPEVCIEPLPAEFSRLADRLCTGSSLIAALAQADRDATQVARAVVVLGAGASREAIADLLGAPRSLVDPAADRLTELGLAWPDAGGLRLPNRVVEHFRAEIGGTEDITRLARSVRVEELRVLADAHGVATADLRKPELVGALASALSDRTAVADRIRALEPRAGRALRDILARGAIANVVSRDAATNALLRAGLLVEAGHRTVVPREIAVSAWAAAAQVTGPPPPPGHRADGVAVAGQAQEFVRHVGLLLDVARTAPIPALKSGGIGKRERTRLVKSLELPDDEQLVLVIDVASAAGLLAAGTRGYTSTVAYPAWRAAPAARRWAVLVAAWWAMSHPSVRRLEPDETELAPPLVSGVDSSAVRHALVRAASDGASLRAAAREVDWYAPFFGSHESWRGSLAESVVEEATRLGLSDGEGMGPLGSLLGAATGRTVEVDALADAAAEHLGDVTCQVLLQSDLTAVVSGVPDEDGARLLGDAAEAETRGSATVYRFSPTGVRRALDLGWTADGLLAGLRELSGAELPQPLEYVVRDAERLHGSVRVHEVRTCVVAEPALVEEIARARALRALKWRRVTSTVLGSAESPSKTLSMLRDADYSPVLDDGSGAVAVEHTPVEPVAAVEPVTRLGTDPREVVRRLRNPPDVADSPSLAALRALNGRLSADELDLLAQGLDHQHRVHITYRSNGGSVTERVITPQQLSHRWLISWCHLRDGEREFTVGSILGVSPAG